LSITYFFLVLKKIGEIDDGVFDWMIVLDQKRKQKEGLRETEKQDNVGRESGKVLHPNAGSSPLRQSGSKPLNISQNQLPQSPSQLVRRPSDTRQENSSGKDLSPISPSTNNLHPTGRPSTRGAQVKGTSSQLQNIEEQEEKKSAAKKKKRFNLFSCCKSSKD
jgi:hypothetical protein